MSSLIFALRLALAAVFLVSGCAKLGDLTGTRRAIADFGTPARWVGALTAVLPIAELVAVAALLAPRTARLGALLGLVLLVMFSVAIAINLAHGRRPECHCFGQIHSEPIGPGALIRNAAIAAVAIVILVIGANDAGPSVTGWLARLDSSQLLALIVILLAAAGFWFGARFALDLLRQHGRLLLRIERLEDALRAHGIDLADDVSVRPHVGLPLGESAPPFAATTVEGASSTLADLLTLARPVLLVFTDPDCRVCEALTPKLAQWEHEHTGVFTIAVVSTGDLDAVKAKATLHERGRVLYDPTGSISDAYKSKSTPAAVLISAAGTIASSLAQGGDEIETLVARTVKGDFDPPPGLPIGSAIPELVFTNLEGASVPLAGQLDPKSDTLVVFWNPSCGFCQAMRDDLRASESASGTRAMIVVSTGDVNAVRNEGFRSPILLDPKLEGAAKLDVGGTPIGVLIGPDATIRSELIVGAEQILAIANQPR
jgi:uncharacterized membrane protein YphA (DoxX/SURF4 family)/thiol-disulfide isomerase/thioredoxin